MENVEAAGQRYSVVLVPEPEEGGYSVLIPALPGCYTQGDTVAEALSNAREAIQGHIESLAAHGEPVPVESETARPRLELVEV